MLPSISHFLQAGLQKLRAAQFLPHKQVELQEVHLAERNRQASVAPVKHSLRETDSVPTVILAVKEPDTEPHHAIVRRRRPAQRYQKLDAMLEELKRDRLMDTDTMLVPVLVHNLARQLHHSLEQKK